MVSAFMPIPKSCTEKMGFSIVGAVISTGRYTPPASMVASIALVVYSRIGASEVSEYWRDRMLIIGPIASGSTLYLMRFPANVDTLLESCSLVIITGSLPGSRLGCRYSLADVLRLVNL